MTACPRCSFDPDATVHAWWRFTIPRAVRSLNARSSNTRGGYAYRAQRKGWEADMFAMRRVYAIPIASTRRRVTLTRLYGKGQRELDRDNLIGGLKPAVDALVSMGIITGDSTGHAEIHYGQEPASSVGLHVLIEELA